MTTLARRPAFDRSLLAIVGLLLAVFGALWLRATSHPHPAQPAAEPAPTPTAEEHAGHGGHGAPQPAPAGYAPVMIEPSRIAALGLATAVVEERDFTRTLRTVGVVALDETRTAHVHARVRGWIDGIEVSYVGQKVRAGEPLVSLYSQDVYSAEIELVSILGRSPSMRDPLVEAARRRLLLWDVPRKELDRLARTRTPRRTFPLLAPRDGTVIAKGALQGMYVEPSLELYTLSDLSRLWVLADVYEADVPYVRLKDRARLTIQGGPASLEAAVTFLSPTLDEATRTRKVRFELDNRDGGLLPGAFVDVALDLAVGKGLAVPEDAIIHTGERSIAFVAHGDPPEHLEPREVRLGPLAGEHYLVEGGLVAGERVATGAQFLLDSESRLGATSGGGGGHVH